MSAIAKEGFVMCHLRKGRKVKTIKDAVQAFHDNDDNDVLVDNFICEDPDAVIEAADIILHCSGGGCESVFVAPFVALPEM